MEYTKDERALIAIDSIEKLEYKHKAALLSLYETPSKILTDVNEAAKYLEKEVGETAANVFKTLVNSHYAQSVIDNLNAKNVRAVTYFSKDYPADLINLPFRPHVLYCKGDVALLNAEKRFAAVGSRKTLPFALKAAEKICSVFAQSGFVIVSGTADGGDRSALLGALDAGGKAISVVAGGLDHIYPESNRNLLEKIQKNGLIISEYPPEISPEKWRYPMRNRLIAALSGTGVLIISGAEDSGTRHTAKFAEAYSKNIFCFPYSIGEKSGAICNLLIKLGKAELCENAEDIALSANVAICEKKSIELSNEERLVLAAIDGETHIDEIIAKTNRKVYEITPILSMLEIKGAISKNPGNTYTPLI